MILGLPPSSVPPNCRFEIDDAEDDWTFTSKLDFIHGRALLTCFDNPRNVLQNAFVGLAPGGFLEMQECLFPFSFASPPPDDCAFVMWNDLLKEASEKMGRPWSNGRNYKRWMEEIGFEGVVERRFYWPTSPWPKGEYYKTIAIFVQEDILSGIEGISFKVLGSIGWSIDETRVFLAKVKRDIKDTSIHAYIDM